MALSFKHLFEHSDESKGQNNQTVRITVLRDFGRFGYATVDWYIVDENNTDLYPMGGSLEFLPGQGEKDIEIISINDGVRQCTLCVSIAITGDIKETYFVYRYRKRVLKLL